VPNRYGPQHLWHTVRVSRLTQPRFILCIGSGPKRNRSQRTRGADPGDDLDRARQRRVLLIALGELPERNRVIVGLRYGADLNASEIATTVGIESAAVHKTSV
jgi:DNA-directed RNA polymerase specialized sigma24 family protein